MLRSLMSKGMMELVFNWHYFYYYVKINGIKHLRETLGINEEVIPITHKKVKKNYAGKEEGEDGDRQNRPFRGRGRGRGRGFRGGRGRGFGRGRRDGEEGGNQEGGEENPQHVGEDTGAEAANYESI